MYHKIREYLQTRGTYAIVCETEKEYRYLIKFMFDINTYFYSMCPLTDYDVLEELTNKLIEQYVPHETSYRYFGIDLNDTYFTRSYSYDLWTGAILFKDFLKLPIVGLKSSKYFKLPKAPKDIQN